ncbi:sodium/glutamate symporter [Chakrabartyella piscis]|uniref:sodium/glutamate symporter n=1 Tax=Chakrabartyella piscis TaxID=2918914 RepID=UPI0029586626|nr:sodium/glutamate symporter [Chakrabartyella piscis]
MEFSAQVLMIDICLISALILVGKGLRLKLKVLQNYFIPSSLIAGFLGLILGSQMLNVVPLSSSASGYAGYLFPILFATFFLGRKESVAFRKVLNKVGDSVAINGACYLLMFGIAALLSVTLIPKLFPEVSSYFGLMMSSGFAGGHGTAAAIGGYFETAGGWADAITVGQTFASIGLIGGALIGVTLINIAIRKGYTRTITDIHASAKSSDKDGLVPEFERESMGDNTMSSMSLDPLTWHFVLILVSVGCAYGVEALVTAYEVPISLPVFGLALIFSIVLQKILELVKLDGYVDRRIIVRIGSCVTDFLVAFAIATLNIGVVLQVLVPILLMCVIGFAMNMCFVFVISKTFFHNFWFERGIFIFGWSTGVMATGITLLRIIDPTFDTNVLEDSGMAWTLLSFMELAVITLLPIAMVQGVGIYASIGMIVLGIILLGLTGKYYGIHRESGSVMRAGEAEQLAK